MEKKPNHSEIRKYDIIFIGGGPSILSFLCHLFQHKLAEKFFTSVNILIIEKSENFGAGCLGKYGINTNTSSEGFVRLISHVREKKSKQGKLALSPSRKPMKVSKNYNKHKTKFKQDKEDSEKFIPLKVFDNLYKSSSVQTLLNIGNRPAPLTLVGYYLDTLGNYTVNYINTLSGKNILLNRKEVKAVKIYNNEEFGVTIRDEAMVETTLKARCVVMASGGKQAVKSDLYNEIVMLKGEDNVYLSDSVLQREGYMKLHDNIISNNKRKIVIIGGSHSAFSCAWIMLNFPSSYSNVKIGEDLLPKTDFCCEECKCFGAVNDRNWNLCKQSLAEQVDIEIKMLYRDHIRVFYGTEQDAVNDGYTAYNKREALSKQGKVYPFIGIRGDAKELYKRIVRGDEKRIKLIKTWDDQLDYIKDADIVIWACGYNTNSITVKDFRGHNVELFTDDGGMIAVDKSLRIMNSKKVPIPNLYGIGQGYSTKAPEIINGKKARADSIHLYNSHVSAKLYKSLQDLLAQINVDNMTRYRRYETNVNLKRVLQDGEGKLNREYNHTKNLLLAKVSKTEKYFSEKHKRNSPRLLPQIEKKVNMINYCRVIQNNILKKN
jgi:lysine/ornithine N-monooxygenase